MDMHQTREGAIFPESLPKANTYNIEFKSKHSNIVKSQKTLPVCALPHNSQPILRGREELGENQVRENQEIAGNVVITNKGVRMASHEGDRFKGRSAINSAGGLRRPITGTCIKSASVKPAKLFVTTKQGLWGKPAVMSITRDKFARTMFSTQNFSPISLSQSTPHMLLTHHIQQNKKYNRKIPHNGRGDNRKIIPLSGVEHSLSPESELEVLPGEPSFRIDDTKSSKWHTQEFNTRHPLNLEEAENLELYGERKENIIEGNYKSALVEGASNRMLIHPHSPQTPQTMAGTLSPKGFMIEERLKPMTTPMGGFHTNSAPFLDSIDSAYQTEIEEKKFREYLARCGKYPELSPTQKVMGEKISKLSLYEQLFLKNKLTPFLFKRALWSWQEQNEEQRAQTAGLKMQGKRIFNNPMQCNLYMNRNIKTPSAQCKPMSFSFGAKFHNNSEKERFEYMQQQLQMLKARMLDTPSQRHKIALGFIHKHLNTDSLTITELELEEFIQFVLHQEGKPDHTKHLKQIILEKIGKFPDSDEIDNNMRILYDFKHPGEIACKDIQNLDIRDLPSPKHRNLLLIKRNYIKEKNEQKSPRSPLRDKIKEYKGKIASKTKEFRSDKAVPPRKHTGKSEKVLINYISDNKKIKAGELRIPSMECLTQPLRIKTIDQNNVPDERERYNSSSGTGTKGTEAIIRRNKLVLESVMLERAKNRRVTKSQIGKIAKFPGSEEWKLRKQFWDTLYARNTSIQGRTQPYAIIDENLIKKQKPTDKLYI